MVQTDGLVLTAVAITQSCISLFGDAGFSSQVSMGLLWFLGLCVWVSLGVCVLLGVPSASALSAVETRVQ